MWWQGKRGMHCVLESVKSAIVRTKSFSHKYFLRPFNFKTTVIGVARLPYLLS